MKAARQNPLRLLLPMLLVVALVPSYVHGAVWYVDCQAKSFGDGTSWNTAFQTIDAAFQRVNSNSGDDEIWVSRGTYYPSAELHVSGTLTVYGGFKGDETTLSQRNSKSYLTIIDGRNQMQGIVTGQSGTTLTVDGLVLTRFSDGAVVKESIAGRLYVRNCVFEDNANGTALQIHEASDYDVSDCTFRNNRAINDGGAITTDSNSNGVIDRCVFRNNYAGGSGGAIAGWYLHVFDSAFLGNHADIDGGAIDLARGGSQTFVNCLFKDNYAAQYGGAAYVPYVAVGHFTNCTFVENRAELAGGAIYSDSYDYDDIPVRVANSILWNNLPDQVGEDRAGSAVVIYSDVAGGFAGTGNIDANPLLTGQGCKITFASPCINAGTMTAEYLPATDYNGNPRVMGRAPDMGYVEFNKKSGIEVATDSPVGSTGQGG